jgi:hypothetical protein
MLLVNKLSVICIIKTDTMVSYLTKITKLRDQLDVIGTQVENQGLVSIALNGLVPS